MNSNICEGTSNRKGKCYNLVKNPTTVLCSWCWNQFNLDHGGGVS